ncbi:MAG: carbon-nitrogen hydrolase family protein [Desulfurococcales archaeon]|nr:carbon-nitrogen hydrolase family protein [Desulfurococcales archaeon]
MPEIRLALAELTRGETPRESLKAAKLVLNAIKRVLSDDLTVLFPENWLTRNVVEENDYISIIEGLYAEYGYPIFSGLAYIRDSERIVSRGYFAGDRGVTGICEKHFPSKAVGERGWVSPGSLARIVEVNGVKIGCLACVDVFYPEMARDLVVRGVDLIYNPASIPSDRVRLWQGILSTRAAENIVFTAGVNTIGVTYPDGRFTGGGSAVFKPDGQPVEALRGIDVVRVYRIETEFIDDIRKRWAFREDLISRLSSIYSRPGR